MKFQFFNQSVCLLLQNILRLSVQKTPNDFTSERQRIDACRTRIRGSQSHVSFSIFVFNEPINIWLWNNFCWIMLPSVVWGRKFNYNTCINHINFVGAPWKKRTCRRLISQVFDFSRQSTPIFFVKPIFKKNCLKSNFRFRHFNFFPSNCLLEIFLAITYVGNIGRSKYHLVFYLY